MQPISTMRWPWNGSSPVVSVSSTISRKPPAPNNPGESPPLRHCSNRIEDGTHLRPRRLEAARGVHDKIGAAPFLGIRHLLGQDRCELVLGHSGPLQHPR